MLRRTFARRVSAFNFGHADLTSGFQKQVHVTPQTPLPDSGIQRSVLPNGTKIVTHDVGGALSSIVFYVDAGPIYDPVSTPGVSHFLRIGLMTSNMSHSLFQIDRAMRSVGAAYSHRETGGKRYIALSATMPRGKWAVPMEEIATGLAAPRFSETDLERFRDSVDADYEETRWQNPRQYVIDNLETVAFYKNPLGSPRNVPPQANDICSSEKVLAQYCTYVQPGRITIGGINVPHEELIAAYTKLPFQHNNTAPHHVKCDPAKSFALTEELKQYTAGREEFEQEKREKAMATKPNMDKEIIVAIGWPTFGFSDPVQYATALTLKELVTLNLDESLNYERFASHLGVRGFYRPYHGVGLVGLTARGDPYEIKKQLPDLFALNSNISTAAAAKGRAEMAFLSSLETSAEYLDFIATMGYKHEDVVKAIRSLTDQQLGAAYDQAKAQKPCMYGTGETLKMPSVRQMTSVAKK